MPTGEMTLSGARRYASTDGTPGAAADGAGADGAGAAPRGLGAWRPRPPSSRSATPAAVSTAPDTASPVVVIAPPSCPVGSSPAATSVMLWMPRRAALRAISAGLVWLVKPMTMSPRRVPGPDPGPRRPPEQIERYVR